MDRERKKELVRKYLEMKTTMGVFGVRNIKEDKIYIGTARDIKSKINSLEFQLGLGSCRIKLLQQDWKRLGEDSFIFEILEVLEYDKDESKIDYSEELKILKYIWEQQLQNKGTEFYI